MVDLAALHNESEKLAQELGISADCALDVMYLRTRHRHTPELEAELIQLHKAGIPPDISNFGCTPETGKAVLDEALASLKELGFGKSQK